MLEVERGRVMNIQICHLSRWHKSGDTFTVEDNDHRTIIVRRQDIPALIKLLKEAKKQ